LNNATFEDLLDMEEINDWLRKPHGWVRSLLGIETLEGARERRRTPQEWEDTKFQIRDLLFEMAERIFEEGGTAKICRR
jgi:hypothetical protein